jgi:type 1 glutamine amidotransferase
MSLQISVSNTVRRLVRGGIAVLLALSLGVPASAQAPLHVHVLSGSDEYESEASLKSYRDFLERTYDVTVTASWVHDGAQDLPGLEHVPDADLLLVFARRLKLPDQQMDILRRHWEQGKPIVGLRTASHAFRESTNQVFDHEVLGGNYQGHFDDSPVQVRPVVETHPVLEGVQPFVSRKLYKAGDLADDATVLQTGTTETEDGEHTHPVTWTHRYHGGRTVYTSLGVPEDFRTQSFRRFLTNALFWAAERAPSTYRKTP